MFPFFTGPKIGSFRENAPQENEITTTSSVVSLVENWRFWAICEARSGDCFAGFLHVEKVLCGTRAKNFTAAIQARNARTGWQLATNRLQVFRKCSVHRWLRPLSNTAVHAIERPDDREQLTEQLWSASAGHMALSASWKFEARQQAHGHPQAAAGYYSKITSVASNLLSPSRSAIVSLLAWLWSVGKSLISSSPLSTSLPATPQTGRVPEKQSGVAVRQLPVSSILETSKQQFVSQSWETGAPKAIACAASTSSPKRKFLFRKPVKCFRQWQGLFTRRVEHATSSTNERLCMLQQPLLEWECCKEKLVEHHFLASGCSSPLQAA